MTLRGFGAVAAVTKSGGGPDESQYRERKRLTGSKVTQLILREMLRVKKSS